VGVFRITVVYYVCSDTKEQAEEEIMKCCGTFYDNLKVEKVSTISSKPKCTIEDNWLTPKVYKGEETLDPDEDVAF